jgi:wyosine [tRNA(Phe)-imidazoG37] synthetase (radical SAM superfamily)
MQGKETINNEYLSFGPVPSRRLGNSLGINNIPPKICSYSCIYCQIGKTLNMQVERRDFYSADSILKSAHSRIKRAQESGQKIDYLTLVPDGEPTLDNGLGKEIEALGTLGIRIAVITNSSLLFRKDVRDDLSGANWVSVKVDAVDPVIWQKINRPSPALDLSEIKEGLREFSKIYNGHLVTETMIVKGINDGEDSLIETADLIRSLNPWASYISIPTRPPAEEWVQPPDEAAIIRAYSIFSGKGLRVELLTGFEGDSFFYSGDVERDILGITAVHPMREDAIRELIDRSGKNWDLVENLISRNLLVKEKYGGYYFFLRKFLKKPL